MEWYGLKWNGERFLSIKSQILSYTIQKIKEFWFLSHDAHLDLSDTFRYHYFSTPLFHSIPLHSNSSNGLHNAMVRRCWYASRIILAYRILSSKGKCKAAFNLKPIYHKDKNAFHFQTGCTSMYCKWNSNKIPSTFIATRWTSICS